jgi:hypothetical protein
LDAAVSLYHQGDNLDRARVAQLAPLDLLALLHREDVPVEADF